MEEAEAHLRALAKAAALEAVLEFMLGTLSAARGLLPSPERTQLEGVMRKALPFFRGEHLTLPASLGLTPSDQAIANQAYRTAIESALGRLEATLPAAGDTSTPTR